MHSDLDFIAGCRCTFLLSIYSNQNNAQLYSYLRSRGKTSCTCCRGKRNRGNKGCKQETLLLVKYSVNGLSIQSHMGPRERHWHLLWLKALLVAKHRQLTAKTLHHSWCNGIGCQQLTTLEACSSGRKFNSCVYTWLCHAATANYTDNFRCI